MGELLEVDVLLGTYEVFGSKLESRLLLRDNLAGIFEVYHVHFVYSVRATASFTVVRKERKRMDGDHPGNPLPWFLFSFYVLNEDGGRLRETAAIAWESILIPAIRSIATDQRGALALVVADEARPGMWTLRQIDQLWLPSESEREIAGLLLFRFEGEEVLRNLFMGTFDACTGDGRTLLYDRARLSIT